jgi:hypothetical protein
VPLFFAHLRGNEVSKDLTAFAYETAILLLGMFFLSWKMRAIGDSFAVIWQKEGGACRVL